MFVEFEDLVGLSVSVEMSLVDFVYVLCGMFYSFWMIMCLLVFVM